MGTTRISKKERQKIEGRAAARYHNNARHTMDNPTCFERRGSEADGPFSVRHASFEGMYARDIVWDKMVEVLGEERADNVSLDNMNSLVEGAKREHQQDVSLGIVAKNGQPTDHRSGLAKEQHPDFDMDELRERLNG